VVACVWELADCASQIDKLGENGNDSGDGCSRY
jgi:hypothetical protein